MKRSITVAQATHGTLEVRERHTESARQVEAGPGALLGKSSPAVRPSLERSRTVGEPEPHSVDGITQSDGPVGAVAVPGLRRLGWK
ncbi:MAG: hypothetical protein AB7W28_10935 [Armatimonadota bacterium]